MACLPSPAHVYDGEGALGDPGGRRRSNTDLLRRPNLDPRPDPNVAGTRYRSGPRADPGAAGRSHRCRRRDIGAAATIASSAARRRSRSAEAGSPSIASWITAAIEVPRRRASSTWRYAPRPGGSARSLEQVHTLAHAQESQSQARPWPSPSPGRADGGGTGRWCDRSIRSRRSQPRRPTGPRWRAGQVGRARPMATPRSRWDGHGRGRVGRPWSGRGSDRPRPDPHRRPRAPAPPWNGYRATPVGLGVTAGWYRSNTTIGPSPTRIRPRRIESGRL